jgi:cysteine synthase
MSRTTTGRGKLYDSILDTIGNTPAIRINNLAPEGVNVYVKFEAFNPAGSVKDRLAISIIEEAEKSGALKPGQTVVEATSGNTGIGLAMVCAAKGYPLVITMAESFSVERRKLMRFLGAKVVLTPKELKGTGMYNKAVELAEKNGWFLASQFETEANAKIHANTTAREILADFKGRKLDYWSPVMAPAARWPAWAGSCASGKSSHEDHPVRTRQRRPARLRHAAKAQ